MEVGSDAEMAEEGEYDMEDDFDEELEVTKTKDKDADDQVSQGFDDYGMEQDSEADEDQDQMRKRLLEESDDDDRLAGDDGKDSDEISDI